MILHGHLELNQHYWFVFVPQSAINLQTVKLEKLFLEEIDSDEGIPHFRVVRTDGSDEFLTVSLTLEPDENSGYPRLFPIDQRAEAEMVWAKYFFKNFQEINGIEFSDFVKLYKKIQIENPEWIL